jgi:hypothetical protein
MLNGFVTKKNSIDTKYAFQTTLSQIKKRESDSCSITRAPGPTTRSWTTFYRAVLVQQHLK